MAAHTDKRISQLKADRDRTRAISRYLKDRRARLESQLCKRECENKNTKRLELLRLARTSFNEEPPSVQRHYLQMMSTTQTPGEAVVVAVQAAVEAAPPEAITSRRRSRGKRASSDLASVSASTFDCGRHRLHHARDTQEAPG